MADLSWIVMQLIDCFLYLFLANSLFGEKIKGTKISYMFFVLITVLVIMIEFYMRIRFAFFLPIVLLFMMSQTKFMQRIFIVIVVVFIVMIVQQYLALSLFPYKVIDNNTQIDLYSVCCAFVIIILSCFIRYVKARSKLTIHFSDIPSYIYTNVILGICAGMLPLTLVNYLESEIPIRLRISILCVSYFSMICSFVSVFLFVKNYKEKDSLKKENQLKNELLNMQERYFHETVKNYEYLRKFRHDIQGNFRVISQLESQKLYGELHSYIQALKTTIENRQSFQCPNTHVSAIVNSYIEDMNNENIQLQVTYQVIGHLSIEVLDLDSLLYNLLSNAFEAEKKVFQNQKTIILNLMGSRDDLLIEIINDVVDDRCIDFMKENRTSKKDKVNHGIGTMNIKEIVDKYNGHMDIHLHQKRLSVEILLSNVICFKEEDK